MKRIIHSSKGQRIIAYFRNILVNGILMSYVTPLSVRRICLNLWGCRLKGVIHAHGKIVSNRLSLGKGSYINYGCLLDNGHAHISIGDNCAIAFNVTILTTNHSYANEKHRGGVMESRPVIIKDGTWVGANVTILPGTIIEKGCVIAAGGVVRGTCEENSLYAGVPARKIKSL